MAAQEAALLCRRLRCFLVLAPYACPGGAVASVGPAGRGTGVACVAPLLFLDDCFHLLPRGSFFLPAAGVGGWVSAAADVLGHAAESRCWLASLPPPAVSLCTGSALLPSRGLVPSTKQSARSKGVDLGRAPDCPPPFNLSPSRGAAVKGGRLACSLSRAQGPGGWCERVLNTANPSPPGLSTGPGGGLNTVCPPKPSWSADLAGKGLVRLAVRVAGGDPGCSLSLPLSPPPPLSHSLACRVLLAGIVAARFQRH